MSDYKEVVCEKGTIAFDGRVVELFGFGRQDFSLRHHVTRLKEIQVHEGGRLSGNFVSFKSRDMKIEAMATFTDEEFASSELTDLINAVQAAAPEAEGA
jgi:hypothetical protein